MYWSVISFAHSLYIVCEDAGHFHIALERTGDLNGSAHVEYKHRSLSAREGLDYELLDEEKRVDFKPGESYLVIVKCN